MSAASVLGAAEYVGLGGDAYYDGGYDSAVFGGGETSWMGVIGWGLLLVIVLIVIWRFSEFRKDRVCVSTDLRDYWPTGYFGLPALPGNDYLPALSQYLPRESLEVPEINRSRTDDILMQASRGYTV